MKKLIICLLVLFCCINAIAQPVTQRSSATITVYDARMGSTFNMYMPRYVDTIQANLSLGIDSCGAFIFTYSNNSCWFRQCSPKKWVLFGSTNGNNGVDTLFAELPLFFDSTTRSPSTIIKYIRGNGIVSGGTVTVDSCRTLDVPPTVITLNFINYTSVATVLTVPVSDPSNPRTDEVIDSLGYIILRPGTPSATPVGATINPATEIILASYTIAAAASCLDVTQIIVWDQNVGSPNEFVLSTSGTISANGDNTDNPFHLTKAIFVSTYTNGSSLIFTKSAPITAQPTEVFKLWVYSNGVFNNQFQFQFFNGSTPVGNPISFNTGFGFNPNDSNQYQQIVIPFSAFNITTQQIDKVALTFAGNDVSGAKGLYLDYLQLQQGNSNPSTQLILTTIGDSCSNATYDPITNVLNIPPCSGGGGGGGNTIYTGDGQVLTDRTVDLNGKFLFFDGGTMGTFISEPDDQVNLYTSGSSINAVANTIDYTAATQTVTAPTLFHVTDGSNDLINIDPVGFTSSIGAVNAPSSSYLQVGAATGTEFFDLTSSNGTNSLQIYANPTANTIDYTAGTHTITSTGANTSTLVVDNALIRGSIASIDGDGNSIRGNTFVEDNTPGVSAEKDSVDGVSFFQTQAIADWRNYSISSVKSFGVSAQQTRNDILVTPDYIKLFHSDPNQDSTVKLITRPDTLLTTPTYVYVPDADTMKVYPFPVGVGIITTFQWSVSDSLSTPDVLPFDGTIFLVGTSPTGAFTGHANEIATYDSIPDTYSFDVPAVGDLLYNAETGYVSQLISSTWVRIGRPVLHQGGDTYGAPIIAGSMDNQPFNIISNDTNRVEITNNGSKFSNGIMNGNFVSINPTVTGQAPKITFFYAGATILNLSTNAGGSRFLTSSGLDINGKSSSVGIISTTSVVTGDAFASTPPGGSLLLMPVNAPSFINFTNDENFFAASLGTQTSTGDFTLYRNPSDNNTFDGTEVFRIRRGSGNFLINSQVDNSTLTVNGSFATAYRAITALRTLDATDNLIECTSGTYTVTLPTAIGIAGREYWITNTGSGTITIGTTSSQTFINVTGTPTTLTVAQFSNYRVVSNGANWVAYKIIN